MKLFFAYLRASLFGLLIANTSFAGLPPTTVKGQSESNASVTFNLQAPYNQATTTGTLTKLIETGNGNLLTNPSFEHSTVTTGWTITNSTASSETSIVKDGRKSLHLSLSSQSGDLLVQSLTPTVNTAGQNLESTLWVYTTLSTIQVCALSGGNEVSCASVPGSGQWVEVPINFGGPSNGTAIGVKAKVTSSSTGDVYFDFGYSGQARNIGTVQQSRWYGSMELPGTSNSGQCNFTENTSTGTQDFVALATSVTCPSSWTAKGNVTAPAGTDYRPTLNNIPPGTLNIRLGGVIYSSGTGASCALRICDGTTCYGKVYNPLAATGGQTASQYLHATFHYDQAVSKTFHVEAADNDSGACGLWNEVETSRRINWEFFHYPSQSQQVYSANMGPFFTELVSAGAVQVGATTTPPTKGTTTTDSISWQRSSDSARILLQYRQSAAGSANAGSGDYLFSLPNSMSFDSNKVTFFTGKAGASPNTCAMPGALGSASASLDTGSAASASQAFGAVVPYDATRFRICVMYSTGTGNINAVGFIGSGFYQTTFSDPITWTADFIAPISGWKAPSLPVPVVIGSVTSNTSGMERVERATVVCGPSSSITRQSGNWISSISPISTGFCPITIATGIFSAAPTCVSTVENIGNAYLASPQAQAGSATSMSIGGTYITGGSATVNTLSGNTFHIICMGPR